MTSQGLLEQDRTGPGLTLDGAREHVAGRALRAGPVGPAGLELEAHLIDLVRPGRRVGWDRLTAVRDALPAPPAGSALTVEPGGQLELSTRPQPDIGAAVAALARDEAWLRAALVTHGLGLAALGTDPARPPGRVNPGERYVAMEHYFQATGMGDAGRAMMCSTAALQVNVEAGPATGWRDRVELAHRLGPVLVAVSACSPLLGGQASGWRSTRQRIWGELDQARCGPLLGQADPAAEWAEYALAAPVMCTSSAAGILPQSWRVPFADWVSGRVRLGGRLPDLADLDFHLTTLFPPVRLRGFLELRCLDAVPARWWPGLAAVTALLLDDPVASVAARAATEGLAAAWTTAARDGLADPQLAAAARTCLSAAELAAPASLRPAVAAYAELVHRGQAPGDLLLADVARTGPLPALRAAAGDGFHA